MAPKCHFWVRLIERLRYVQLKGSTSNHRVGISEPGAPRADSVRNRMTAYRNVTVVEVAPPFPAPQPHRKIQPMCVLRVLGSDPLLMNFATAAGLRPLLTVEDGLRVSHHSGKSRPSFRRRDEPGTYGFNVSVSRRAWEDLKGQFSDAIEFLAKHRESLLKLRALRPDSAVLDFPAEVDPETRHVVLFDVTVPVELSRASSEVGLAVEITLYFSTKPGADPASASAGGGDAGAPPPVAGA